MSSNFSNMPLQDPDELRKAALQELQKLKDQLFETHWRKIIKQKPMGKIKQNFVKEMLERTMEECNEKLLFFGYNPLDYNIAADLLEQGRMIEQICDYHLFYTSHLSDEARAEKQRHPEYRAELANIVSGNILVGNLNGIKFTTVTTKNSPEIIAYNIFADRVLTAIYTNVTQNKQKRTVVDALIEHAMGAIKGTINSIADGLGSSAIALWRQLHEEECVIISVLKGGNSAARSYFDHQRFFELEYFEDKKLEEELEMELKKYELDKPERQKEYRKRCYINYGWLLKIPTFYEKFGKQYKLDFKNGVEAFAEQSDRFQAYAEASKVTHPTAKMLAAFANDFYVFAMTQLYLTVSNLAMWIIEYIKAEKFFNDEDLGKFIQSTKRDLEQLKKNNAVIQTKYPPAQ